MTSIRSEHVGSYIGRLGERIPAPGGGAAAGLNVAQAAALLAMVARYSTGERFAAHQDAIGRIIEECDKLADSSLQAADDDAAAFAAVGAVYAMPKATEAQKQERADRLAAATLGACRPPLQVIDLAARLVALAEELLPIGNRNVLSDIGAAAEALRAAAATARINVEVNLPGIADEQERAALVLQAGRVDEILARSQSISHRVRGLVAV